ncbi:MAG: hypothetical protein KatS3mg015_2873 [Fimbriimonadales bacterium]|jgi:hypothetical protein|nr:MAG: hypothetical protein KatS3mg015_2873 [Fimbriimonadales bacterium]
MPRYEYACPRGHVREEVRPMDERTLPAVCDCGMEASYRFSPPHPANIRVPMNFRAIYGSPTWSDVFDVSEKELAKMPGVEKYAVAASQPGVGNTISQPGAELKRKVREARARFRSDSD